MYPGRTTTALIKGVIEVDDTTWPDLSPFIDMANELVTEVCASEKVNPDGTGGPYYSDHRLELIETQLAAHFYAISDAQIDYAKVSILAVKFQVKIDLGFDQTKPGQQATRLDTRGGLAALNNKAKVALKPRRAGVFYVGGTECEMVWDGCNQ